MARALDRYFQESPGEEGQAMSYESNPPRALDRYFKEEAPEPSSTVNQGQEAFEPHQGALGFLERSVAGPVAEGAISAITAPYEAASGLRGLTNKGIDALFRAFGVEPDAEKAAELEKIMSSFTPSRENIKGLLSKATGGRLEPQTDTERVLQKGAGIVGDIAGFGGPAAALGSPLAAAGTIATGGTTAYLEEAGVNPWIALGGGILADIATRSFGSAFKKLVGLVTGKGAKTLGETAAKVARLSPDQVKQGVIEAGERLGIKSGEIPLAAQLDSPAIQGIETHLRASSLAGRSMEKQLANIEGKAKGVYEGIANDISSRAELLPGAVSSEAISQLKNVENTAVSGYRSLYNTAERLLPEGAKVEAKIGNRIIQEAQKLSKKLSGGTGTPAKDALQKRMERLTKDFSEKFPNGEISVKELQTLKTDLNDIIKYEVRGGVDKMLTPLKNMSKNAIQEYAVKNNKPYAFYFNKAESEFGKAAKNFRKNDAVKALLDTQNPEQILQKMRNVKTYRELKDLFSRTPEGTQSFKDLSRYMLEDMLGQKILNKNGEIMWGKASGMLKNPKNREILREIVGPQNYKKLKDLAKFSSGIEEGLRKFANTSQSATKGFDIALLVGTISSAIKKLFFGSPLGAATTAGTIAIPSVMAKSMSNPEFIEAMIATAKAGKGTNSTKFFDEATRAASLAIPMITSAYETNEGENQ